VLSHGESNDSAVKEERDRSEVVVTEDLLKHVTTIDRSKLLKIIARKKHRWRKSSFTCARTQQKRFPNGMELSSNEGAKDLVFRNVAPEPQLISSSMHKIHT